MSPFQHEPDARTLARFLSGQCSAHESADLLRWARSSPEATAQLEELRAFWAEGGRSKTDGVGSWDSGAIWNAIAHRIAADSALPPLHLVRQSPPRGMRSLAWPNRPRWHYAAMAMAACGILAAGIWAIPRVKPQTAQHLAARATEAAREYRTGRGQRALLKLPDGSAVQLGPQSLLRVSSAYNTPARTVTLEGDAYFNVTHDAAHPFAVRLARGEIRDLGTRFVVRARPGDARVEVAVAEGRVSIGKPSMAARGAPAAGQPQALEADSLVIDAGELGRMEATGAMMPLRVGSVDSYFAWTTGRLVFDRTPLPQVLAELSRWFDEEFVLADKALEKVRLTTVLRGETLSEALLVLRTSLDVETRVENGRVTLSPRLKDAPSPTLR